MKKTLLTFTVILFLMSQLSSQNGQFAKVNGLNMYYEIHGEGKPLVLIHGAASTIQTTFGRVLPELAKKYKVIAVELQAHGHTADIDRPLSFESDADDVIALLDHLKIEKADFFGFSNGGTTVLQIAIRHPQRVNKLIASSSIYKRSGVPPQFWEFMKQGNFEGLPEPYKAAFRAINPDPKALYAMFDRCRVRMQEFKDIPDRVIEHIKAPVLILQGDKDVPTAEHAAEMLRRMPKAQLMILPGAHGEFIGEILTPESNKDQYKSVLPLIMHFLDDPQ